MPLQKIVCQFQLHVVSLYFCNDYEQISIINWGKFDGKLKSDKSGISDSIRLITIPACPCYIKALTLKRAKPAIEKTKLHSPVRTNSSR